jgi:hypothetical protein
MQRHCGHQGGRVIGRAGSSIPGVAASLAILLAQLFAAAAAAADAGIRQERVQFAKGATSAVVKGRLKGDADVDYLVRAGAGQTLAVTLKGANASNYFNVLPPGSKDVGMFVGSTSGNSFTGVLPADGDYAVRVYLMRSAARRNESSDYTLTVGVTGKPLAPLPASRDALVPGTAFHATAQIACVPYLETLREKKAQTCEAGVTRRGFDGTATVEIPQENSVPRRILFVKGKPVASDSSDPLTFTRRGDVTTVKLGDEERYEIPDALVAGG